MIPFASASRRSMPCLTAACVLLAAVLLGSVFPLTSSAADDFRYLIQFKDKSFIPAEHDYTSGLSYLAAHRSQGAVHVLVQMAEVPGSEARTALADQGLTLQGYLPGRTYYALASADLTADRLSALGVRWMGALEHNDKVAPRVLQGDFGPWTDYNNGQRIFAVQFHDDVAQSTAEQLLAGTGGEMGGWIASIQTGIIALAPAEAEALADDDLVKYVDQLPPVLSQVNDGIRASIGVNTVQAPPYNLNGSGASVLVYDAGMVDRTHPDFGSPSRVTWGENGSNATHSTHVGGTVGGDGHNSSGTYKGMAPGCNITSYYYPSCSPYCLYNSPQDIEANYRDGLFTHSDNLATNSLGSNIAPNGYPCSWEGDYEQTAQLIDAISHGSLGVPFLSVWAAGNERGYGYCGTTYNTTGIPATAKDNIVVGATNSNDHSMTYFSSWGPVDDGRLRPDICAPGCQNGGDGGITSTVPGGGYQAMCGTSMATPATAGVIALLLQEWHSTPGLPLSPSPSTVKALLVNTAQDYGNAGPDYQFGYGEIRPVDLIDHLRNGYLIRENRLDTGQEIIYRINVPQGQTVLKATASWADVQGQLLAQVELVNDIDLTLESPSGVITLPWILTPSNPSSPATRGADHLNPLEQVLVNNPETGTWLIHVRGYQIPNGPQTFSIVANAPLAPSADVTEQQIAPGSLDVSSYPNPFRPQTTIRFRTDSSAPISLYVFDSAGRRVRTLLSGERRAAGTQFVTWDGKDEQGRRLPAGAYFYQVVSGDQSAARKVLMLE